MPRLVYQDVPTISGLPVSHSMLHPRHRLVSRKVNTALLGPIRHFRSTALRYCTLGIPTFRSMPPRTGEKLSWKIYSIIKEEHSEHTSSLHSKPRSLRDFPLHSSLSLGTHVSPPPSLISEIQFSSSTPRHGSTSIYSDDLFCKCPILSILRHLRCKHASISHQDIRPG